MAEEHSSASSVPKNFSTRCKRFDFLLVTLVYQVSIFAEGLQSTDRSTFWLM
jgi:hypothetical protein